jgi:hypothetical protein
MVVTEWFELRGGFIVSDVIRWRDPVWAARKPKDRNKRYTGEEFGSQQIVRIGMRIISAEVIEGPDEDGWVYLLVRGYDNTGTVSPDKRLMPPPAGKEIRRKYKTLMNGEPERLLWDDETARARLVREVWGNKQHAHFMSMDEDDED